LHLKRKGSKIQLVVERKSFQIDFRHLETFSRVAELKSFSKAASDLFLTQPTVSGHILSLEQSLSLRLFDRTGKGVRLTKAGEVFLKYASKILSSRKDLLNALSEFSQGIRGELSLGASTIPGEYLLPKLMGHFKKEHPYFIISLKIADTKEIVQYALQDNIELGIIGAKLNHSSLHYEKFDEDEIIVVAPSDHPLSRKKKVTLEELLNEPWIIREEGSGTRIAVENALRKKGMSLKQLNVVMEMGSTSSLKEGVKAKLGLAFISRRAAEEELNQGVLSRIDVVGFEPIFRQIYIVSHRGRTLSPIGIEFYRFLQRKKSPAHRESETYLKTQKR
jgi:DNA-binding transcriptional LysR family regulator